MTRDSIRVGHDEITFRVTSEESGGDILAAEVRLPAGGGPPMLHRHPPAEIYRVEQGELAIYVEHAAGTVRPSGPDERSGARQSSDGAA